MVKRLLNLPDLTILSDSNGISTPDKQNKIIFPKKHKDKADKQEIFDAENVKIKVF